MVWWKPSIRHAQIIQVVQSELYLVASPAVGYRICSHMHDLTNFCLHFLFHCRGSAAPPAGDGVCSERSLPARGRFSGHLQWPSQRAVSTLRHRDNAGAAPAAPAETWSVPAQHRPKGGLHPPAADTGHQHGVRRSGGLKPKPLKA